MKDNKKSVSKKKAPRNKEKSSSENSDNSKLNEQSKRPDEENSEKEFPGYPHYSATDDIYNQDIKELELNEEGITQPEQKTPQQPIEAASAENENEKSEADVTEEDLKILDDNLSADQGGEDDQLRFREAPVDMTAEDLDVPGSELDDAEENIGEEDEENNPYSIGGDRHEDLEENRS